MAGGDSGAGGDNSLFIDLTFPPRASSPACGQRHTQPMKVATRFHGTQYLKKALTSALTHTPIFRRDHVVEMPVYVYKMPSCIDSSVCPFNKQKVLTAAFFNFKYCETTAKFRQQLYHLPGTQPDTTIMLPSYSGHYFLSNTFCLIFHDVYPKSCTSCVLRNLSIGLMSI